MPHDLIESQQAIRLLVTRTTQAPLLLVSPYRATKLTGLTRRQLAACIAEGRVPTVQLAGRLHVVLAGLEPMLRDLLRDRAA